MKEQQHGLWMWWKEVSQCLDVNAAGDQRPRADHAIAQPTGHAAHKPRAHHAHCAFGLPLYAPRRGDADHRAEAGVNWRERKDLPWILLLAGVVVAIIIFGIYSGGPTQ